MESNAIVKGWFIDRSFVRTLVCARLAVEIKTPESSSIENTAYRLPTYVYLLPFKNPSDLIVLSVG